MSDTHIMEGLRHLAVDLDSLTPDPANARLHGTKNLDAVKRSLNRFGQRAAVVVQKSNMVIRAGNARWEAARSLGWTRIAALIIDDDDVTATAYAIADNRTAELAEWDHDQLNAIVKSLEEDEVGIEDIGFDDEDLISMGIGSRASVPSEWEESPPEGRTFRDRFMVAPFSVLNAREGYWQDRKRAWIALGIQSELGRADGINHRVDSLKAAQSAMPSNSGWTTQASIFDPVLCELSYRWFCPPGGIIFDPFAGGSVRGVVAGKMDYKYIGIELQAAQVEANRQQAEEICDGASSVESKPRWIEGDSLDVGQLCPDLQADMIFTCPPYTDLEIYSDDPRDLSTMKYPEFRETYSKIIQEACGKLKENRFACVVVGEVRDKKGNYYNFVGDTVEAFKAAGLEYYNEAILVTCVGSLPVRAGRYFEATRKLGKTHQNILVFVKGAGKRATMECGDVDMSILEELEEEHGEASS